MKVANCNSLLGLAVVALLVCPWVHAAPVTGWYLGAGVGESRAKIDEDRIGKSLRDAGFTTVTFNNDERDIGFKLFSGYQFTPNFALEGGYFDLGKFGFTANTVPASSLSGTMKVQGVNLDLVGTLPFTEKFSGFARAGVNYAESTGNFSGSGLIRPSSSDPSSKGANYKYGLGLQYAFTPALAVQTEMERYRVNNVVDGKSDIDLVSVSLVYRFGAKTPEPPPREIVAAPAVLAVVATPKEAPPPPVVTAIQRPLPVTKKLSLSTNSHFEFDSAAMNRDGKTAIDKFYAEIAGDEFSSITITGHTDRIGTSAYNSNLSLERAESAKVYLVGLSGISAEKVVVIGAGEADPLTEQGECEDARIMHGMKANKQSNENLIACLQPDRRVDIEVSTIHTISK